MPLFFGAKKRRREKLEIFVLLKNGFRFSGQYVSENEKELILIDKKIGRMTITKQEIAARKTTEAVTSAL